VKVGVLGTGQVGQTLATKLVEVGHEVRLGSRDAANENATEWASSAGEGASNGTFADAAAFGEIVFNCTAGTVSLAALELAGDDALRGKILVDVSNALDFSGGPPPTLAIANNDSVAEQIQRRFPEARVVKSLNTVNHQLMVNPALVPGEHNVFVAGDDPEAKAEVVGLLESFGWPAERILDLGGVEAAQALEMYLALWLRLLKELGTPQFNIGVMR
jgi:predicted dinucleotide-binding enzyme